MRRACRYLHASTCSRELTPVLLQVRVVTDPKKLAQLHAESEKRKKCAELKQMGIRRHPLFGRLILKF